MTPEERRKVYPPFIFNEIEKIDPPDFQMTKITDFLPMITCIWKISSKDYQERFWVRQELPMRGDTYMETMETFLSDSEGALNARDAGRVSMTDKQYEMIKHLVDLTDEFECDPTTPQDLGNGLNDPAIVADPKWHKVREYAKLVYEEITGEKLNEGPRSNPNG